jgi:spore coat protein U-like protein
MKARARSALFGLVLACVVCGGSTKAQAAMSCTIVSVTGVSFGAYDVFNASPLDSAGAVSLRCTSVAMADMITIQLGRSGSGGFLPRAMSHGRFRLEYNLFLDAARTVIWGDGTSGTSAYTARPAEGVVTSLPIFGRIPPRQNVEAASYSDQIVLTLLF